MPLTVRVLPTIFHPMRQAHQRMVNLTHRLDALSSTLARLEADPATEPEARRMVILMRAAGEWRQQRDLTEAASRAENASRAEFPARLRALVDTMAREAKSQQADGLVVLIVSTDATVIFPLRNRLTAGHYHVLTADTLDTVRHIVTTSPVACCIVDLVMAGLDGRSIIATLRATPATAALPLIALIPEGAGRRPSWPAVRDADACFEKPIPTDALVDFISMRRKRGPLDGLEARRDPSTTLLNRAACREAYAKVQETGVSPIAFALIGIHRFSVLAGECGPAARDELLRSFGAILASSFRSTDITARWDLAEFAVILAGEDPYGATLAIEKILASLNAQTAIGPSHKGLPVTVCAGLTVVDADTHIEEAASRAERHLYAAFRQADDGTLSERLVSDTLPSSRHGETIALCLTDDRMAKIIRKVLEHETFAVELFTNAEVAASRLTNGPFSLAILDDALPDRGAFMILNRITQAGHATAPRILMLSGDEAGTREAMKRGADDFALKPPDIPTLLSQIRRLLRHDELPSLPPTTTVLIVDHEIPQLLMAGAALHQLGDCRVLLAHGAKDGLARLADFRPEVLILDSHLPSTPAPVFLASIPDTEHLRTMEVVLATDILAGPTPICEGIKILGSITRPYKPAGFIEELRALIPLPHATAPARSAPAKEPLEAEIRRILTPAQ